MKAKRFAVMDKRVLERVIQHIQDFGFERPCDVTVGPHKDSRSLAQNRTLHGWMNEVSQKFAEATGKFAPAKWWKEYFKEMFLGEESFEVNGKVVSRTRHTSDLNTADMAEFMTKVDHYCGSELNIYVTLPGQDY